MASGDSSRVPSAGMLQNWNPMMEDFESDFNSYDTGPGRDLPTGLQRTRRSEVGAGDTATPIDDLVQLYVTGIPDEMSDEGLANLFSQAGKVVYAHKILSANKIHDTSYGFVKFTRPDEAAAAIAKFHRFQLQQYELRVSVALNGEQKAQRAERRKKQDEFLNSLKSSNTISDNGVAPSRRNSGISANGHMTTLNMNSLGRGIMSSTPLNDSGLGNRPQFNQSPGVTTPRVPGARNVAVGMGRGLEKLGQFVQRPIRPRDPHARSSGYSSDAGSGEGVRPVPRRQTPCHVCRKIGTLRCSKCKDTWYCGRECQLCDWPQHQIICVSTSSQEREFERRFDIDVDFLPEPVQEQRLWKIDDLRQESLPSEFTIVVLMDVISPNNFCVVKDSLTPQLQSLKDEMNLFFDTTPGPGSYVPSLDEVCAARYESDGEWYRVHVHRVAPDGSTFDVTYVDFGNLETVSGTYMRPIQPEMTVLPLQAIRCSLELRPPSDAQQIANFNRLSSVMLNPDKKYNCQPIGVTAGTHTVLVKLLSIDGNEDIAEFIVRQAVGVRSSSPAPVRNDIPAPAGNDLTAPGRNDAASAPVDSGKLRRRPGQSVKLPPTKPQQTPKGAGRPTASPTPRAAPKETAVVPPVPLSVLSQLPSVARSLPVADGKVSLRVQVLEVVTPGYFLVRLLDNESDKLTSLHKSMMEHYGAMPPNTVFRIQSNTLYAARFNGSWYRALAYNAQGNTVCVQYLDYGNRETVSFAEIHPLESRFCTLLNQAVCCGLAGVRPKSGDWTEALTGVFKDELLSSGMATVCAYEKDRCVLMVELRCEDKTPVGATINKLLLSRGLVVASTQRTREGVRPGAAPGNTEQRTREDVQPRAAPGNTEQRTREGVRPGAAPCNTDRGNRQGAPDRKKSGENAARDGNKRVQATKTLSPTKRVSSPTMQGQKASSSAQQTWKSSPTFQKQKASSPTKRVSSPTMQQQKASSPATQKAPSPSQQTQKPSSPAQQTKTSDVQPKAQQSDQKTAAEKSKPTVAMLATIKPPADCPVLIVTASSGPEDITVQFVQAELVDQGQKLAAQLETLHATYSGTYTPVVGELICAKFSADGTWYRAEVLQVKDGGANVRFVDYGNTDDVSATSMSALSDSLLAYPVMGVKCRLEEVGTAMWDESLMRLFQPWTIKKGTTPDKLELFDQECQASLCLVLVSSAPSVPPKGATTLRNIKVPECERIHIRVTDAADPEHVNVQIVEEDYIPDMMQLNDELAKIEPSPLRSACKPGDVVCARFSADNNWYRAIVLELTPEGANVRFLDYGNMEVTPVARLAAMPDSLMRFPMMSVACVLSEVTAIAQSEGWQCMLKLDLLMTVVGHADGGRIVVELFDAADGSSLNEKLVSSGVCTRAGVVATPASVPSVNVALASNLSKAEPPSSNEPIRVQVVEASKSHESITLQVLEGALLESLSSLTVILEEKYASSAGGFMPTAVGELVCAKFDHQWYRAEVVSLKTSGGDIRVHFVDYGNTDDVGIESLAKIDDVLLSYPVLGLRCRLAGVAGLVLGSTWDEAYVKPFNVIHMRVVDVASAPIRVELIDGGVSLNEHLVNSGVLLPAQVAAVETVASPAAAVPSTTAVPSVTIGSLKHIKLPAAEKMLVQLTDVASQGRITVQLLESEYLADLTSLTKTIIDTYNDATAPYAPRVGEVVCAKTGGDWYRGSVAAVNTGIASVHFFDFGDTEDVSFTDVAQITDDSILGCPILGVECRLDVGPEWKKESLVLFAPVLMTVVESGDGPALVELFNPETGTSLTEKPVTPQTALVTMTDLTTYKIPPGRVRVRVSDASGPRDVTVQVLQDESLTALQALSDALAAFFAEYRGSYAPQCGEIVCARFALDNTWYRAEVLSVADAAGISVRFVDFGNSDVVNAESVAKITPELCAFPVLGIKCRLAGVAGMATDRTWDPAVLCPFEVLTLTVESANGDGCAIKLYDDADCLNTSLINSGVLIAEPLSSSGHGSTASVVTPSPTKPAESSPPQPVTPVTPTTERAPASTRYPIKTSPLEQPPAYIVKSLPTQPLPEDRPHVMPCHLESPHEFYAQSLDPECVAKFTSLNEAIGTHYDTLAPTAYNQKLGELIAAFCVADNAWYRAVITEFYRDTHYKVVFVDYGNADLVAVGSVRRLDARFAKLPRQAIRMSLFGMNSTDVRWSGVAIRSFSEEIINKPCVVDVARTDGDVVVVADISTSDGASIVAKMVSDGQKILLPNATSAAPQRVTEDVVKIGEIASVQLHDADDVTVCLVHAVSPSEFSVLLLDNQAALEMQVKLNEHCKTDSRAYHTFARDEVVCALYENVWYRCVVLEASVGGFAKLCFFDFGNTERMLSEHIRRMPRNFATIPQQAIQCSIGSIAAPSGRWSSKAIEWFAQLVNKCFKAKWLGIKDGHHLVDIRSDGPTGGDVAQEMISLQFGTSVVLPGGRPTLMQRSNIVPVTQNGLSAPPTGGNVYRLSDLPVLSLPDEMDVVVVEVTSPGLFFCHRATLEAMNTLNELITKMDERCNKLLVDATFDPQPGDMCCALFKGNWYRAVVERRQANKASLLFVDFGNSSLEDVTNLRSFSREFCPLPPQAIKCAFAGLKPNGPTWTPDATLLFKSLVVVGDTPLRLYMIVVERPADGGVLYVKLVDTTGEELNGRDVGAELVARLSTTVAAPQPAAPLSLEDENAKLKRELEELKRMMLSK